MERITPLSVNIAVRLMGFDAAYTDYIIIVIF
jgi:hypothetical protein